jgi:O-methyltransferase
MRLPRFLRRPASPLNAVQTEYLSLLKKLILNSVYHPNPEVTDGRIWPEFPTLSMAGLKRLDNIQELALDCLIKDIPGDFIEAGIWKGGMIALLAGLLKVMPRTGRHVVGVDSFEGIPPAKPALYPADAAHAGCETIEILKNNSKEEVEGYLTRLDLLPSSDIELLKGWFCDVLPRLAKRRFCLVRLDGDTYESTIQGLENLEPILSPGGYMIIDDYYSWDGCRAAVNDFRAKLNISSPLVTVDWTCVYWKKQGA